MYARSTTILARPESIDAGVAHVRDEVLPALQGMPGCTGLSMMVNRETGHCIATSAWESEDAMRAAEAGVGPIRDRVADVLGGSPQVDEWEIAVLHRDHRSREGACVRSTWSRGAPDQIDDAITSFRMGTLAMLDTFEGFCSASLLVNRGTGMGVASVTYDSLQAMEATRERGAEARAAVAEESGIEIVDVVEFELAIAHLDVPEMA
ncbi:MAG: antibiotic biosynthesis monooxygenase [Nocardioidaceae bacterium]